MSNAGGARAAPPMGRFFWNRKIQLALLFAIPSLLGFAGAQLSDYVLDADVKALKAQGERLEQYSADLDRLTRDFENFETLRASFSLELAAASAAVEVRYALDKLYRLKALGSLRRIAAGLDTEGWKARVADYEKLVATDYSSRDDIEALQQAENAIVADAKARLTAVQARSNAVAEQAEKAEDRKNFWSELFKYLGWVATIVVFFVKENK